jgi:hypothetical protein
MIQRLDEMEYQVTSGCARTRIYNRSTTKRLRLHYYNTIRPEMLDPASENRASNILGNHTPKKPLNRSMINMDDIPLSIRFRQLKAKKNHLCIRPSGIHGWGVFTKVAFTVM